MIKDSDDCFEDLAKSYPELMEKSRIGDVLGVDVGWFNIIDSLCSCIYEPVSSAKNRLKAATEYPRNDGGQYLSECEERYKRALSELPAIIDIKEKFAGLRFYTDTHSDRNENFIQFAEMMSRCTCEKCGAPGELDTSSGWVKTHCKEHITNPDFVGEFHHGRVSAKFQDNGV